MSSDAAPSRGPWGRDQRTPLVAAVVAGVAQLTVGFFTMTAIGLVSVPLWAAAALVGAWLAAAAALVATIRRRPLLAVLPPVVNGLVLWAAVAAGEAWLGWTG